MLAWIAIKGSLGVRDSQKLPWDFQKSVPGSLGLPSFSRYLVIYNKHLEWIYVLFSLKMVVLLYKWEFKNIEVEFLKVSEKIWSPGLELGSPGTSWFWQCKHCQLTKKIVKIFLKQLILVRRSKLILCFFCFFFYLGFTALSRIFHLYWADHSSKVGENRKTRGKPPDHP